MILLAILIGTSMPVVNTAWDKMEEGKYTEARRLAESCVETYEPMVSTRPGSQEEANKYIEKYAPLSIAAECLSIKALSYAQEGKTAEAIAAYQMVVNNYRYLWTVTLGTPYQPAKVAAERIAELQKKNPGQWIKQKPVKIKK